MKTSITVDNLLISDALAATGLTATDEVVEMALRLLIQIKHQDRIKAFRGKLLWDGDLDKMRRDT